MKKIALTILIGLALLSIMPIAGCGGDGKTVSVILLTPDGTERNLSDTPLPINLRIQMTFPEPANPTQAEALFSLQDGNQDVSYQTSWNGDNTVMTVRPNNVLNYQTTYTVSLASGDVTSSSLISAYSINAFSESFTTMVARDINGDGLADLLTSAQAWEGGILEDGGTGRGRCYLFYGDSISSGDADTAADVIITGQNENDQLISFDEIQSSYYLNFDLNDDGYEDIFCFSIPYPGGPIPFPFRGRTYIFFGAPDESAIEGDFGANDADLILTGDADGDLFFATFVGDVNGDDYSDLVAVAYHCSGDTGCVYIFFGPDFSDSSASEADVTITGEGAGNEFGAFAAFRDVSGDGITDIIVMAPMYNFETGAIYVFYGGSDIEDATIATDADVKIVGDHFAGSLTLQGIADVNGDGIEDILAISVFEPLLPTAQERVYIFFGGSLQNGTADDVDDITLTGESDLLLHTFGRGIMVGDVTGDGVADLLVEDISYGEPLNDNLGRIYVFEDGSNLVSKGAESADFHFTGEGEGNELSLQAIGDVTGDGVNDIVATSTTWPGDTTLPGPGRTYVFEGGDSMTSVVAGSADIILTGETDNDRFGRGRLFDINGDGVMDLFISAARYPSGNDRGRGYLFYGGSNLSTGDADTADVILTGENLLDRFAN